MTTDSKSAKAGRPARSVDEEIAAAEGKLRALRERKRAEEQREYERNRKAIFSLLRDEGLDRVAFDQWQQALPRLRQLLGASPPAAVTLAPVRKAKVVAPAVGGGEAMPAPVAPVAPTSGSEAGAAS